MLVKNRFYEGVPVGVSEFNELFTSVNKHMDSLLTYALSSSLKNNVATRNGGSILGNAITVKLVDGMWMLSSEVTTKKGLLFAKTADPANYFVEEIPYVDSTNVPVVNWQVLATGNDKTDNRLKYKSDILPKFPVYRNAQGTLSTDGFYEVRYNGIPQTNYVYGPGAGIVFDSLTFGAEYPHPTNSLGKFVGGSAARTFSQWVADFGTATDGEGSTLLLRFPYSNFGTEVPYILLREAVVEGDSPVYRYYALKEDRSSDINTVASNSFKVLDRPRGIVRVKLNNNFVRYALGSSSLTPSFTIIIPEQLMEYNNNGVVEYKSRYGSVYNGNTSKVELVAASLKGDDVVLKTITNDLSTIYNTDILFTDRSNSVSDMVFAVRYEGIAKVEIGTQRNKFFPDVINLFYSTAVPSALASGASQVRAFVEVNKASWYNQNVAIGEYRPVSRIERGFVTLCTVEMAQSVGINVDTLIDPDELLTLASNAALPEYTYAHKDKVTMGQLDKYVRADATIPEPHHVNAPMIKMYLPQDETLYIPSEEQMVIHRRYRVEGTIVVDGFLIID